MRQAIVGVAAFAVLVATAAGARQSVYQALRTTGYPDTALPAAFSSAKVKAVPLSPSARSNGAVGAVEVDVDGPDANAGVVFVVFKTSTGAASDLGAALPSALALKPAGKVSGQPRSLVFAGSSSQTDALGQSVVQGVTYAVVESGDVLVSGFTYSPTKLRDGGGAVALVRSGLKHLQAVTG
jgi:hypothetical protein